ncbi:Kelch motif [Plasmodiophora brassicae]|uniref:Uncharacterized protein n=1 Tax=Plasmodiophora brassicae TaxID=37360 RepID=A0A0G4IZ57_PLABS|nr:hypothetical protein PBRA_001468 [Plasmodiophora brassicae]SPQ94080.1 unnamed protein product [Plasmodiophora brassicae]
MADESLVAAGSDRAQKLAQHLENRPTPETLVEHNILKSFRADPSLHEVMQALIRTRRESELGTLLKRRRSLQDLIDKNIIVAGPPGSPNMRNARQKLLKHLQRSQLSNFLVNRPSLVEVAKLNVLEDTLIWTRVQQSGTIPSPRNCGMLTAIDDNIYLTGGFCAEHRAGMSSAELLSYNLPTETWSRPLCAGSIPCSRFAHSSSVVGKQLVVFGGCTGDGRWLNDVHVLDTEFEQPFVSKSAAAKHTWKQLSPQTMFLWYAPETSGAKPCARAAHTATTIGTQIVVFGGNDGVRLFNDIHILEVETMGWSKPKVRGTPPTPRAGHAAALVDGHLLFVFGGGSAHGPTNSIHVLDLETLTWTDPQVSGTPPSPRLGHSMHVVLGPRPQLLVFGGGTVDKLYDDLHVFDCATGVWSRPRDTGSVPAARTGHASCLLRDPVSNRESLYFFGGAGNQGQLFNDFYLLDCAFFNEQSLSTPSRTTPGYDAEAKQVVYEDSEDVPAENASLAVEWNARVEDTRSRIEDLLAGVKRRMHLVQDQAVARERQMAEAMQRSLDDLRAEVDAISACVSNELNGLLHNVSPAEDDGKESGEDGPTDNNTYC